MYRILADVFLIDEKRVFPRFRVQLASMYNSENIKLYVYDCMCIFLIAHIPYECNKHTFLMISVMRMLVAYVLIQNQH